MKEIKTNHSRRITEIGLINLSKIKITDIVSVKYSNPKAFDKQPLLYVTRVIGKYLEGFNLNYMSEILVQKLLNEIPVRVSEYSTPRFKRESYNLYKKSLRITISGL